MTTPTEVARGQMERRREVEQREDALRESRDAAKRARMVAGMGFWRLACVVAVGILIANVASWVALFVWSKLMAPGILNV